MVCNSLQQTFTCFVNFQFNSYDPKDGQITERDFADMLLTYSSFHEKKKQKILRKVKKHFKENSQVRPVQKEETNKSVTCCDYFPFDQNWPEKTG